MRALLQSKAPFDPSVRALRNRICESYEAVILEDHEFAESHEVEQAIWRLQYKCIEEFRLRLRKSTAAAVAAAAASAPVIPMPGAKVPPARRDTTQKILSVFKSFLSEATGFYHNLISKLRAKHGLPQDYSPYEAEPSGPAIDDKRAAELKSCDLSCHRCFIFLGDLARYKESHGNPDVRSRDWSVAAGYYQQAISLWPSSGNPHNQVRKDSVEVWVTISTLCCRCFQVDLLWSSCKPLLQWCSFSMFTSYLLTWRCFFSWLCWQHTWVMSCCQCTATFAVLLLTFHS